MILCGHRSHRPFSDVNISPFFIYILYSKETEDDVLMFSKKIMQCLGQKEMLNTLTYAYVHPLAFEKNKKTSNNLFYLGNKYKPTYKSQLNQRVCA